MSIIEVNNLTKYYGKARGIIDVSFNVDEGEIFGFIGPNGAGKSTTIRLFCSLIYATSGSAKIFGKDCFEYGPEIRQEIGYLPSEVFYYDRMKVLDLLKYSASFYDKDCTERLYELAEYISPLMRNPEEHDFFTLLREAYISGIQFAAEHPEYAGISKRILENKDAPVYRELMAENLPSAHEFFETLLENAVARGEVREDIDIKMFAYIITSMNAHVVEYYMEHVTQDLDEGMLETIDKFVDFLRNGIGRRRL